TPSAWAQMKEDYVVGQGSLRQLARKYHASFSTVGKRAVREHWTQQRTRFGDMVESKLGEGVIGAAQARGEQIGSNAAAFVARSQLQTGILMDAVDAVAQKTLANPDPESLNKVATAWERITKGGRAAYGLVDGHDQRPTVRIGVVQQAF